MSVQCCSTKSASLKRHLIYTVRDAKTYQARWITTTSSEKSRNSVSTVGVFSKKYSIIKQVCTSVHRDRKFAPAFKI